jgi:glycolate oxidase
MSNSTIPSSVIAQLKAILGADFVLTSNEDRICYSYDGQRDEYLPDAVVRPSDAEQVSKILYLANDADFAIVPRGGGTGLSGGAVPSHGGVVLDLTRMNRIIEIDPANMHAIVEPGVITATLAAEAEKHGLLYPPDPGTVKVSTIGGNVAENAGGLRAGKYGVTRNYLMQLKAVAATGEAFLSGARTRKCVAGYDLVSLLCGSEGTLGIVTEVTARLVALPKYRSSMTATFSDAAVAGQAISSIIASGLVPATLEIIDNVTLRMIENFAHLGLPVDAGAMVLAEFDGLVECAVSEEAEAAKRILVAGGALAVSEAKDEAERDRVWQARRVALAALSRAKPTSILEDVTVPLPELSAMVARINLIAADNSVLIGTFGHAGDGNLHPTILTDERDREEMARVENAVRALIDAALELGGTISGEHGIGFTKAPFLKQEVGSGSMEIMRRIKNAFDPNNILNPGKFI